MAIRKDHKEFHTPDPDSGWETPAGYPRGIEQQVKGLRIGAAPGPVDGLRRMLAEAGIDPERDLEIGPVPGTAGAGVSFGVAAAWTSRSTATRGQSVSSC